MNNMVTSTRVYGNIGKVEDLRYTPNGRAVLNFSVAADKSYRQNGEKIEKTVWFNCSIWGPFAESMHTVLPKAKTVLVEGSVEADAYLDKDGKARAKLILTVNDLLITAWKNNQTEPDNAPPVPEGNLDF